MNKTFAIVAALALLCLGSLAQANITIPPLRWQRGERG